MHWHMQSRDGRQHIRPPRQRLGQGVPRNTAKKQARDKPTGTTTYRIDGCLAQAVESERIDIRQRISIRVQIRIHSAIEASRVTFTVPANDGIVIPEIVVVREQYAKTQPLFRLATLWISEKDEKQEEDNPRQQNHQP